MNPESEAKILVALSRIEINQQASKEAMERHEERDIERFAELGTRIDKHDDKAEITGRHELVKVQEELVRQRASKSDWLRLVVAAVLGFAFSVVSVLIALAMQGR